MYDKKINSSLSDVISVLDNEKLVVIGTSITTNFSFMDEYVIDNLIWEDEKKILFFTIGTLKTISLIDDIKREYAKLEIENEHLSKRGRMMFADDNNILEVQNIEKVDFEFQNVEDYYDLIILDDVDHVLTVEQLSKLIFSAKKLIIKTIDRPESIIYKTDLSVFFLRYIDENLQSKEENNDSDFYIYREKMAYFNGFEENNI